MVFAIYLPLQCLSSIYQDPETKVNYSYVEGYDDASVNKGIYEGYSWSAGSPDVSGDITILSEFTIKGKKYTVTSIEPYAFISCNNLTSITIPHSITKIHETSFAGCSGLTRISVDSKNTVYSSPDECNAIIDTHKKTLILGCQNTRIPANVTAISNNAFSECSGLTSLDIPNSVTTIGDYVFYECTGLTSLDIPNSVTSMGEGVFSGCSGLTSLDIPNSVTSIGNHAFSSCTGLTSLDIPNSVTTIGYSAFSGCSGLTSVTIPNSVTSIGAAAFWYCENLTFIEIPGSVAIISTQTFTGSGLTSIVIHDGVTTIGDYAFNSCPLTSIDFPSSLTSIGVGAFASCPLSSINIPNNVTSIAKDAFEGCYYLTSIYLDCTHVDSWFESMPDLKEVTLGNNVISIGNNAFKGCDGLTSVTIGNSVASIGDEAFLDCSSLTNVVLPNSVTSIGKMAFDDCISLTSVTIGNSVASIGDEAFLGCSSLTNVVLPNSVTSIGKMAFYSCVSLTSLIIPNSVKMILEHAFYGCFNLTDIYSYIEEPFKVLCFDGDTRKKATLFVPSGSIPLYETTAGWEFKNIIGFGGQDLKIKVTDSEGHDVTNDVEIAWYDADGKQLGSGPSLGGIQDSTIVYYSVLLDEDFGRVYREVIKQQVQVMSDTIFCQLEKIGKVNLFGRVSATDIDKTTVTINVRQMLNRKYEQIFTTETDKQGLFKVEVFDDDTDITISGDNYLDATFHRDGFSGNGNVGTIPLNLISGFAIAANITLSKAVFVGDSEDVSEWSGGLNNIEFEIYNATKSAIISDFTIQNGSVIIKTGAETGDDIRLTVKSKQGKFADASTMFKIEEGANTFSLVLTELGGIDVTCASNGNSNTIGYLYDTDNKLVAKGSYVGETLSLRHIHSGTYTLVSMGNSTLLGNMTNLSNLSEVGLVNGSDYVSTTVTVTDGVLTEASVNDVPKLNDTRFYYTSGDTYFNVNKESLTAGNYLTLSVHLDYKPEYKDKVDVVKLSIDIPEGCQVVENSVIANRQTVAHTIDGNRLMMNLGKEQWQGQIRFCIIPTLNQSYTLTAIASFDIDGEISQPIGTAQFEAKGLSLSTPEHTANSNININGTAKGHSEVSIYDNDVLIGKTSSLADGSWTATCELYKPYSHSFHDIYAKIVTDGGMELTSETQQVEYDKNRIVPSKVTMTYYNGWYKGNKTVEFDLLSGITSLKSYPFYQGTDFTFLADFTRNDTTAIKNVSIKVLNSDGTVRTLPATFDRKLNKWVATTKYSSSSRLPTNVTVEYDAVPVIEPLDSARIIDDNNQFVNLIKSYIINVDSTKFEVLDSNESMIYCKYQTLTMDNPVLIRLEKLNYDEWIEKLESNNFISIDNNGVTTYMTDSLLEDKNVNWLWTKDDKMLLKIEISSDYYSSHKKVTPRRSPYKIGNIATTLISSWFTGQRIANEYREGLEELQYWLKRYNETINAHFIMYNSTKTLLDAKCKDGTYKVRNHDFYKEFLHEYFERANEMRNSFQTRIGWLERDIVARKNIAIAINAALAIGGLFLPTLNLGKTFGVGGESAKLFGTTIPQWLNKGLSGVIDGVVSNHYGSQISSALEWYANNALYTTKKLNDWYGDNSLKISNNYSTLKEWIRLDYKKCIEQNDDNDDDNNDIPKDDNDDFHGNGATPRIDPSGYVYEAVTSNRLEGVTVTCYQKVQSEDMYGDITEEAVVWNAEDYSQRNPLKTDATGFYRWDVPQGMWQVKYEKDGYETVYSEWLPVPPPQLDVNIGMKQSTPPTVKKMQGSESGITIELSKYMRPTSLNNQTITVSRNGIEENGAVKLINAERSPLDDETFVSKVKFVPEMRFHVSDDVFVTIHKEVESYCGVNMTTDHVEKVKIEPEITAIRVDSVVTVAYQGTREVQIMAIPAEAAKGRTLIIGNASPMIVSVDCDSVVIGENGIATVTLSGELPGSAVLEFHVDSADVSTTAKAQVVLGTNLVATPTANIPSGSTVESGAMLTLSCETEGATIFYTLDGSCPCDETTRILYESPIVIVSDMEIKAIAVKEDMDDSDVASFIYLVRDVKPAIELAVTNPIAGELKKQINDSGHETKEIGKLKVTGLLNGTDIKLIREMIIHGKLSILDIESTSIVSGGEAYYENDFFARYTENDVLGAFMFSQCEPLKSLSLPKTAKRLKISSIAYCDSLSYLIIPESCTEVEDHAIYQCRNLEKVTLSASTSQFSYFNCSACPSLLYFDVQAGNSTFSSIGGVLFCNNNTIYKYPMGRKEKQYIIPDGTMRIEKNAFSSSGIEHVIIPSSIKEIGDGAFQYCFNLSRIDSYLNNLDSVTIEKKYVSAFFGLPNDCEWHVIEGLSDSYKKQQWWIPTWIVIDDIPSGILSLDITEMTNNAVWYNLQGIRLKGKPSQPGIYLYNGREVLVK